MVGGPSVSALADGERETLTNSTARAAASAKGLSPPAMK